MVDELDEKLMSNSLLLNKIVRLTREEKQLVVNKLLKNNTIRGLAKKLGVDHSTVFRWKTMKDMERTQADRVSIKTVYYRLLKIDVESFTDWGRLEMIKEKCEELLKHKK